MEAAVVVERAILAEYAKLAVDDAPDLYAAPVRRIAARAVGTVVLRS